MFMMGMQGMGDFLRSGMLLLALFSSVSLLLSARKLVHFFQLESYQFLGYWKTIKRQKVIFRFLLLAGLHFAANALCIAALLLLTAGEVGEGAPLVSAAGFVIALVYMALCLCIGLFFRKQGMKQAEKKKLALTPRLKRFYLLFFLLVTGLFIGGLCLSAAAPVRWLSFPGLWNAVLALLLPLLVALAAVLVLPLERLIFRFYFRDAEKKLLENERLIRIGITGSYGKTSTKFILETILSQKFNVLATPASFNTPMGVSRIIRERLTPAHQVFIGEMGARHVGEIKELCRLVHPIVGILTAVGPQHLDTFRTLDRIEKTKYELIDALPKDGFAVFLHDDAIVTRLYEKTDKPKALAGRAQSEAWAEQVTVSHTGSHFLLHLKDWAPIACDTPLLGKHNIQNILTAAVVAKHLGLTREQIMRGIAALRPVEHRLQLLKNPGGITVIDDAFNTNPRSSKSALEVLASFPGRRVIVTPGMVELGADEERYNFEFGVAMAEAVDIAVLVGRKHTAPIRKGLISAGFAEENIHSVASLNEALALNRTLLRPGDVVMYENDLPDHYSES